MVVKAQFKVLVAVAALAVVFMLAHGFYAKEEVERLPLAPATFVRAASPDAAPITLEAFKGQVVLVNLWASWCTPCVAELPALDALQARMHGKPFKVVPISLDRGDVDALIAYWQERGIERMELFWDRDRDIPLQWKYEGLPTSFLIDRNGNVARQYNGAYKWDEEEIFADITALLMEEG